VFIRASSETASASAANESAHAFRTPQTTSSDSLAKCGTMCCSVCAAPTTRAMSGACVALTLRTWNSSSLHDIKYLGNTSSRVISSPELKNSFNPLYFKRFSIPSGMYKSSTQEVSGLMVYAGFSGLMSYQAEKCLQRGTCKKIPGLKTNFAKIRPKMGTICPKIPAWWVIRTRL